MYLIKILLEYIVFLITILVYISFYGSIKNALHSHIPRLIIANVTGVESIQGQN